MGSPPLFRSVSRLTSWQGRWDGLSTSALTLALVRTYCTILNLSATSWGGVQITIAERGVSFSECSMTENARISGCANQINVESVEREVTPRLLMRPSVQLHLADLSISDTFQLLDIIDADRIDRSQLCSQG